MTAVEATTSLAADIESTWKGLLAGESGIRVLEDEFVTKWDLPVRIGGHLVDRLLGYRRFRQRVDDSRSPPVWRDDDDLLERQPQPGAPTVPRAADDRRQPTLDRHRSMARSSTLSSTIGFDT